ncbi:MAG: ABC transporter permease [Azospirillum sp.]|nr:ABC transporter permease [Azospirillum sp.]
MSMAHLVVQLLSGLAAGSVLFLIASGLSIIFGVTRIVNFAHGSFTMLGAYLTIDLIGRLPDGGFGFWAAVGLAALVAGGLGVLLERLVLRRLYRSPELFPLLATFGVVLIVQDAALALWGPEDLLGPRAPGLTGTVLVLGLRFPVYDLFLIALGPVVLGLLRLVFHGTGWGTRVRAATEDPEMAAALGIDQHRLFTGVLFLGSALAGLGGALQVPREAITLQMDMATVIEAFVVVVIGGMGSLGGAFVAALLIGVLQAFGILAFPRIALVLVFLVMAVVLMLRPNGLFGRAEPAAGSHQALSQGSFAPPGPLARLVGGIALGLLALVPLAANDYSLIVLTEIFILALFAASLHFLLAVGGMVSFGHAAFFGLGAYGAALAVTGLDAAMLPALALAPLAAGLGAALVGALCVRLGGVYLAMLTLAFAQILWSIVFQWSSVTGGDNGLLGIWPEPWASGRAAYYWLTLVLCAGAMLGLRRLVAAPFGYALRASRDSALRAAAVGLPVDRLRWLAFALAGALAGLAGGLQAFAKGSVFPALLAVPTSVDGLVMVLLGGLEALSGPLVGAAVFHGLETEAMRGTGHWRLLLGAVILAMVLVCPSGLSGVVGRVAARLTGSARRP